MRAKQKVVFVAAKTREDTASVTRGACVSENIHETEHVQSVKRQGWIQKIRKRLQRVRVALPVWPTHQLRHSRGETRVKGPIVA